MFTVSNLFMIRKVVFRPTWGSEPLVGAWFILKRGKHARGGRYELYRTRGENTLAQSTWLREHSTWIREHSIRFRELSTWFREHSTWFREYSTWFGEHSTRVWEHSTWLIPLGQCPRSGARLPSRCSFALLARGRPGSRPAAP